MKNSPYGIAGVSEEIDNDVFLQAYLEMALFSTIDVDDEPYDKNFTLRDFSLAALEDAKKDCDDFRQNAGNYLAQFLEHHSVEKAGGNFWLSRNGHGAGFFDEGTTVADKLQELCRPYGSVDIYQDDDNGRLYFQ